MKLGGPVAGAALLLATLGGASAGALLLGTAGADPSVPDEVTTTAAASTGRCGPVLAAVVHAVGVPADELRSELASGATLAQVAEANGVETQVVVDALVAGGNTRIDSQLANGRLTEAQAERRRRRSRTGRPSTSRPPSSGTAPPASSAEAGGAP
jgi:hypothetical protein